MTNNKYVLITGATTGMGRAFAFEFARLGYDLFLHGRNQTELEKHKRDLESKYQINCKVIIKDLVENDASDFILSQVDHPVDYLVNNAGFGVAGKFQETNVERQLEMQRVHVEVPMKLTHHFINQESPLTIINIASLYAFFPVPRQSVYASSKSMLHSFTLALARDLNGTNKKAISVCPGLVYTQFRINQGKKETQSFSGITSEQVVAETMHALSKNKPYIIPGFWNRAFKKILTSLPTTYSLRIIEKINTGRGY